MLLHYKKLAPPIQSDEAKVQILHDLMHWMPKYQKGDYTATWEIATQYKLAVIRAKQILTDLLQDGLPSLEDSDVRNEWLCSRCVTFSTVFKGIEHLQELKALTNQEDLMKHCLFRWCFIFLSVNDKQRLMRLVSVY